jgi:hypothetical protein
MAAGSHGLRGERAARLDEETGAPDSGAGAVLRAPRPKSWSPPLPPHRVPVPPPPLGNLTVPPAPGLPLGLARALPPPVAQEQRQSQIVPIAQPSRPQLVPIVPPARPSQIVPVMRPLPPPPLRMPPATLALPGPYEDRLSDDFAFRSGRSGIGRSGIGWPATILMALAAGVVMIFAVVELRPDLAARAADTIRGTEAPAITEPTAGSMPATSPAPAGATAPQRAGSVPGGASTFGATSEPPTISVWSLPTARAGQAPPTTPMAAFHAAPPLPAAAPQRGRFVPSAAYAFNFNAAPPPPSLPPILAQAPAAAPAPPPPPVEEPVAKTAPPPKAAAAAEAAPAAAAPPPVPAPKPAAPPPPPPKPHFAPGSLEDQIQKAVDAEAAKKNQNH